VEILLIAAAALTVVGVLMAVLGHVPSTVQAGRVVAIIGVVGLILWLVLDLANGSAGLIG
jgi:heme/copper-type cytochrome/quinol oxidase subunit 4